MAAKTGVTQLVEDVEKFPGHIACDGASKSEIVVPIIKEGRVSEARRRRRKRLTSEQVVAIIDIDCAELDGFGSEDREALEDLAELLAQSCDF
jgi:L-methionine (R)-S-oxide reductase